MIFTNTFFSPIGRITVKTDDHCVLSLSFDDAGDADGDRESAAHCPCAHAALQWLAAYFDGERSRPLPRFRLAADLSPFQKRVLMETMRIPYAQTITYGELARRTEGRAVGPMAARAVGTALGKNNLPLLIPCHRVIGADGHLRGYAWGLERKAFLLDLEQGNASPLPGPSRHICSNRQNNKLRGKDGTPLPTSQDATLRQKHVPVHKTFRCCPSVL
ncbi:MAG: methylated-DNA--[protein]-cysteine S-methyltransferase [Desulfovibrio sp.]|nr:methylated-DNA--[protein]-cysteine S-methyltransferase [Desulfovibrio sp.]